MPDSRVFARLVAIAEFMLQARLPEPTRQLLATTVDAAGGAPFAQWLATYDVVSSESNNDKRLVIREQTQEAWVSSMRLDPHPLAQALVAIYDAANTPIAAGWPPLTGEAADAVLDIYVFQSSIVNGVDMPVPEAHRAAWRAHLAAAYPALAPSIQQWIAAAHLTAPMMRAAWSDLAPAQQNLERWAWAAQLPQLKMFVDSIMQSAPAPVPPQAGDRAQAPGRTRAHVPQPTPQQIRRNDQMYGSALRNISQAQHQAMMAAARGLRS
jgi:hypothetical protein